MSEVETAWLAGLFEGEACFIYAGKRKSGRAVRIVLAMSDKDVVARAYAIVGSGHFNPDKGKVSRKYPDSKPMYEFSMAAQSDCRELMQRILPFMGQRRSEKLSELIAHIEAHPNQWNRGEGGKHGGTRRASSGCECDLCEKERARIRQRNLDYYYRTKEARNEEG